MFSYMTLKSTAACRTKDLVRSSIEVKKKRREMLTFMSCSNLWLTIFSGLFFRHASRSTVDITDSRRSLINHGHFRSDILVTASPLIELDGAPESVFGLCPVSLGGGAGLVLLFLILTTVGW